MKTIELKREKFMSPKKWVQYLEKAGNFIRGESYAALVGVGNVGRWFLGEVNSKGCPYEFTLIMDSEDAIVCKEGIKGSEVAHIYKAKEAKKGLNEVNIPYKEVMFYDVGEDQDKVELLKELAEQDARFSKLILATPSSDKLAGLNRELVYTAIDKHSADIVLATKNVLNSTKNFNNTMKKLSDKGRYIAFNGACGVRALTPTIVASSSEGSGDVYIESILNASTNMFLKLLCEGYTSHEANSELVRLGSLEPDGNISGEASDIRKKTEHLRNVIQYVSPEGAEMGPLSSLNFTENELIERANTAKKNKKNLEIVSTTETRREHQRRPRIDSYIDFKEIDETDLLSQINGLDCGVVCRVGGQPPIVHFGPGAGKDTGAILLEDLWAIYFARRSGKFIVDDRMQGNSSNYSGPVIKNTRFYHI